MLSSSKSHRKSGRKEGRVGWGEEGNEERKKEEMVERGGKNFKNSPLGKSLPD